MDSSYKYQMKLHSLKVFRFFPESELSDAGIYSRIKECAVTTRGDGILKL